MKTFRTIYLVLIVLTLSGMAAAQKGKPSPTPTPTPAVITAKFNYCAPGDTVCEAANRVRQDADRAYTNGQDGVVMSSALNSTGDIVIFLNDSTRTAVYDLRDRVHDGNPQPTWTSTPQNFKVQFVIHDANNLKAQGTCAGAAAVCEENMVSAMNGGFYIGKVRYRFQWNPTSVLTYINWVEDTSPVNINYKRDATGQTWTVTPIETSPFSNRYLAGMQVEDRRESFGGQYNMPFTLVVNVK